MSVHTRVRISSVTTVNCNNCCEDYEYHNVEVRRYYRPYNVDIPLRTDTYSDNSPNAYFQRMVVEFNGQECPHCEHVEELSELDKGTRYKCPECETLHEGPHDALLCCVECDGSEDDGCFAGCNFGPSEYFDYAGCHCHEDCPYYVCVACHAVYSSAYEAGQHWIDDHATDDSSGDNENVDGVNVGGPATLPPAMEYEEEQEEEPCQVCASEFCCSVHNHHRSPHRGCRQAR